MRDALSLTRSVHSLLLHGRGGGPCPGARRAGHGGQPRVRFDFAAALALLATPGERAVADRRAVACRGLEPARCSPARWREHLRARAGGLQTVGEAAAELLERTPTRTRSATASRRRPSAPSARCGRWISSPTPSRRCAGQASRGCSWKWPPSAPAAPPLTRACRR